MKVTMLKMIVCFVYLINFTGISWTDETGNNPDAISIGTDGKNISVYLDIYITMGACW